MIDIGGKMSIYNDGHTNSIALTKFLKNQNIVLEGDNIYLCYLVYFQTSQIQAIYKVSNPEDDKCILEEIYNKLNEVWWKRKIEI